MAIYFYILAASVLMSFLASKCESKVLSFAFRCAAIAIVTIPAAVRYGIGRDFLGIYVPAIEQIRNGVITDQEYSFHLIVKALEKITEEPQFVFVFFSVITYIVAFLAFTRRGLTWAVIAYMMHYYAFTLSGIRQGLAVSFILWCVYFLLRKKWVWSCLALVMAVFIHRSSAIFLLPIIFAQYYSKKHIRYMILCVFLTTLLLWVVDLSAVMLTVVAKTPYAYFLSHSEYIGSAAMHSGLGYMIPAAMFFCLFYCLYLEKDYTKISQKLALMCAFAVFVYAVAIHLEVFKRFTLATDAVLPFAFARLASRPKTPKNLLGIFFVLACLVALFCKEILTDANYGIIPYTTIFDEGVSLW